MGCNRKTKTNSHPTTITLNWCVYIFFYARKVNNLIKFFLISALVIPIIEPFIKIFSRPVISG